jgi:tetratricopeptide (TPR) repeat protein
MGAAIDPFHPFVRMIERYRHDVHELYPEASAEALSAGSKTVGAAIPPTLHRFLSRWNGAVLFRGALRVRPAAELAPASVVAPDVIIFADGPSQSDLWGFLVDRDGRAVFGRWDADTERFHALHARFDRWLAGTIKILDEGLRGADELLDARLDVDPDSVWLLFADARRALAAGRKPRARALLERATEKDPTLIEAWADLGRVLHADDPIGARAAWLHALRAVRLPCNRLTRCPEPVLITDLESLYEEGEADWEQELTRFWTEAVREVSTPDEARFVEAVALSSARARLARGERPEAAAWLGAAIDRMLAFEVPPEGAESGLLLARLLVDLGLHDDAERRLRRLRKHSGVIAARALLLSARIAVVRQEPWVEVMLQEVREVLAPARRRRDRSAPAHARELCEAWMLSAQRARMLERMDDARKCVERARNFATIVAEPLLLAELALLDGDVARQAENGPAAEDAWRQAHELADGDPELMFRVLIRRGDLYAMTGDEARAQADYGRAADGFARLDLPVREAWARLRLGRMGFPPAIEQARALFRGADMAAGVAAADAAVGEPSRSVGWHLERAAQHARDRTNAQRSRPPLSRADAERPERRLGAHRLAISSCDVQVVHTLASQLDATARSLERLRRGSGDPAFARYVATVDLIAAHRSYDAAEVLLRQLLEVRPQGLPGQALVAAMARSPNAALVDGLLEALEGGFDPEGMAAAAEVLGWRREVTAAPVLRKLVSAKQHRSVRKAAIVALGRVGDRSAVDVLLPLLDASDLAGETSTALLLLGEWRGVDARAQTLARQRPDSPRSLGEIVGRYGGPNYLLLLYRAVEADGPSGMGAIHGLGYLGEPRAVGRLIDVLAGRDPLRAQVASGALELITGHHEDPEESLLRNRWMTWWDKNGHEFREGQRYRHGRLYDPGLLIERLRHGDPAVRRTSYDELVISTGATQAFDAEGPYRVQQSHCREWGVWWDEQRSQYPSGGWFFHGERIG